MQKAVQGRPHYRGLPYADVPDLILGAAQLHWRVQHRHGNYLGGARTQIICNVGLVGERRPGETRKSGGESNLSAADTDRFDSRIHLAVPLLPINNAI
jgi:hypothetical protein